VGKWSWHFDATAATTPTPQQPETGFPSQADAEQWVGEHWRELLAAGIDAVTLRCDDAEIYGPMSLRPGV
jgi:hypothetical protein